MSDHSDAILCIRKRITEKRGHKKKPGTRRSVTRLLNSPSPRSDSGMGRNSSISSSLKAGGLERIVSSFAGVSGTSATERNQAPDPSPTVRSE